MHLQTENRMKYRELISQIHELLLGDSKVVKLMLRREEGPFTDPKISNYILGYFGNSLVDYSSHLRKPEKFERGDLWFYVISENPKNVASYISQELGYAFDIETEEESFEKSENNWRHTVFNYARMPEMLKEIYTPQEMARILRITNNETNPETDFPSFLTDFLKDELVKNLESILMGKK